MNITIVGTGYVGLVTGTCLAEVGNQIVCVDNDHNKIERLKQGEVPIFEPGLDTLIQKNASAGRLLFTTSINHGVSHGEVIFIAVGTPPGEDGSADLSYVLSVAGQIADLLDEPRIVVNKSTVPVGTADLVRDKINKVLERRSKRVEFSVISNPEFLKEGAAIDDFMKPDRIVIGADSEAAFDVMRRVYAPFNRNHERVIEMDVRSSELTKYAANALLATKISFMNEMANIADRLGADIENIRIGIGSDPRIGYDFIYPGCGYGGSCFPKDVQALKTTAKNQGYDARILNAVEAVNEDQKKAPTQKLITHYGNDLSGITVGIWGLSFKPNTDDMREAPSVTVITDLLQRGAGIKAYDPVAGEESQIYVGESERFAVVDDPYDALAAADALVLLTEWKEFRAPDFERIASLMKNKVIVDGRNIFDPQTVRDAGFTYYGIGRP